MSEKTNDDWIFSRKTKVDILRDQIIFEALTGGSLSHATESHLWNAAIAWMEGRWDNASQNLVIYQRTLREDGVK
jgi:hypothetical protein